MEIIPKLEIGAFRGKVVRYKEYKFICRLLIPHYRNQIAIVWLREKGALILGTKFEKPYSRIVFTTNNCKIVRSIHHKYGSSEVDARLLYEEIDTHNEKVRKDFEEIYSSIEYQGYGDEYFQDIQREILDDMEDYSNAMIQSSEQGWFYDEPNSSQQEALRSVFEEEWRE